MKNTKPVLIFSLPLLLTACGGGGGGSSSPYLDPVNNYDTVKPVLIETYDPLNGSGTSMPVDNIFVANLNDSSEEEVVIAGRMSQFATPDTWQTYDMQIFGWNTGEFQSETDSWFASDENRILGTEPSLRFGDFNSDGYKDMLVAHSTDMEYFGPSYVYFNSGSSSFSREEYDLGNKWIHDAVVADFDNDGVDDFFLGDFQGGPTLALSNNDNTFQFLSESNLRLNSNSLAAGDFLNNNTTSILMLGSDNQALVSWSNSNGDLVLTKEKDLPASRFYLSKWDDERAIAQYDPESIRAFNFDFNNDGVDDVVVINTLGNEKLYHKYTEVQFLENDGSGNFSDVTDSRIESFDTLKSGSYNPVLTDVNGDGLLDIMLTAKVYTEEPSTSILLQSEEGTFTEQFVDEFVQLNNSIEDVVGNTDSDPLHSIVTGPNNEKYIVSLAPVHNENNGVNNKFNKVFLSEIGNNGTITASNTVSALKSQWPWMTDAQANEILSFTASNYVDGMPVIDYRDAMAPVGPLSLTANNGERFNQIKGHVSGINLSDDVTVLVTDRIDRTFSVNLNSSVYNVGSTWNSSILSENKNYQYDKGQSLNLVNSKSFTSHGISIRQDESMDNYSISFPSIGITDNLFLTASFTNLDYNPWINMSGMWGSINQSNISEGTLSYRKGNWVSNIGMMHTQTDMTPGLITEVNDIYAAWGDIGWQHEDNILGVYTGVDPVVISGSVTVSLPSAADNKGNLMYSETTISLISEENFYIRAFFKEDISDNMSVVTSGIIRQNSQNNISVNFNWNY